MTGTAMPQSIAERHASGQVHLVSIVRDDGLARIRSTSPLFEFEIPSKYGSLPAIGNVGVICRARARAFLELEVSVLFEALQFIGFAIELHMRCIGRRDFLS